MFSQPRKVAFELPSWIGAFARKYTATGDIRRRMGFVIAAARKNVEEQTGGPFAAAIFEAGTGALVSLGVNLVLAQGLSFLHAEMVAIAVAQRKLGVYDLGGPGLAAYELLASTEPCTMCLGAIVWSGVRRVVTAACDQDARDIGFDEGPKPADWVETLQSRGIDVLSGIERDAARGVLLYYLSHGGLIYNSRRGNAQE
ncbi:MAG: nucleoside deaminase [Desulfobacteraceae bacterium]|nr:nucleoside deaminase [Desulfobacteraceae bacterium]